MALGQHQWENHGKDEECKRGEMEMHYAYNWKGRTFITHPLFNLIWKYQLRFFVWIYLQLLSDIIFFIHK